MLPGEAPFLVGAVGSIGGVHSGVSSCFDCCCCCCKDDCWPNAPGAMGLRSANFNLSPIANTPRSIASSTAVLEPLNVRRGASSCASGKGYEGDGAADIDERSARRWD